MLSRFLRGKRTELVNKFKENDANPRKERYNFIFGNESCDQDSALSALLYAWFCSETRPKNDHTCHVPVLNVEEDMFRLKTETVYVLQRCGVGKKDLIFRDTLSFEKFFGTHALDAHVTLVDHHVLQRSDEFLSPYVKEIIDHRPQSQTFDDKVEVEIAPVGSCMTLIAEKILRGIDSGRIILADSDMRELTLLVSGPILLDTVNLSESAGKVTVRDREIIKRLWKDEDKQEISSLFKQLCDAKYCVDGLTVKDLLLKDQKTIHNPNKSVKVIFSTIHAGINRVFEDKLAKQSLSDLVKAENANLLVALYPVESGLSGNSYKPVLLYAEQPELKHEVENALKKAQNPILNLEVEVSDDGEKFTYFRMHNVKASRKQLLPIVQSSIS